MTRGHQRRRRILRRSAALIAGLGLLTGAWLPGAGPASAHAQLTGSLPQDGAVLDRAPAEVTFTFNEDLLTGSTTIAVVDSAGTVIAASPGALDGPRVSAPLPALGPGTYQVSYRVVSADGHPVTGAIAITIAEGATPAPGASSNAGTSAGGEADGDAGDEAAEPAGSAPVESDPPIGAILLAIAAAAVVTVAIVVRAAARRRPGSGG